MQVQFEPGIGSVAHIDAPTYNFQCNQLTPLLKRMGEALVYVKDKGKKKAWAWVSKMNKRLKHKRKKN
jgi:hypothetical protein